MQIRGIVQGRSSWRIPRQRPDRDDPLGPGVGPNKPRSIVVPYELLLQDPSLDPDQVQGHGFEAEIEQDEQRPMGR